MTAKQEKDPAFERLLQFLQQSRGFDFTEYQRASLMRRVIKRMSEVGIEEFDLYEDYLEVHPQEFAELFNTILINVTSFFRDKDAWDYLAQEIIPQILEAKTPTSTIRVWSAGCASGEEAYSVAMLLAEAMGVEESRNHVKIYATDVDDQDLEVARHGIYNAKSIEYVPEDLRKKYFTTSNHNGQYAFRQDLRSTLVFGRHNLMHDAPISRLDLLLCRNTLIYFNREAQKRIVVNLHFALKETGFLFLGRAETMLTHADLFESPSLKQRIFRQAPLHQREESIETLMQADTDMPEGWTDSSQAIQEAVFKTTSPARVVVDGQGILVMMNEEARTRFSLDLRDMHRPFRDLELSYRPVELRSLIEQAHQEKQTITLRDTQQVFPKEDGQENMDISVTPLWGDDGHWLGTAISFVDVTQRRKLEGELEQTQHDMELMTRKLQFTHEELQSSSEELQSTVEELQTTNEELQSTNEERETMNEELQSTNNELEVINDELRNRTVELNRANAFLESILASVDVAVVVIDGKFRISLWNEHAEEMWGLRSGEVKNLSLLDLDIGLPVEELKIPIERFLADNEENEKVILDATNRRGQSIRCSVMRTVRANPDGAPQGVVLLMEEVRK
jgi:two-component system CheB/CheR fusion protein